MTGCDCGCWDYQQLKAENERLRKLLSPENVGDGTAERPYDTDALVAAAEEVRRPNAR